MLVHSLPQWLGKEVHTNAGSKCGITVNAGEGIWVFTVLFLEQGVRNKGARLCVPRRGTAPPLFCPEAHLARNCQLHSHVLLFVTPRTVAHQAPQNGIRQARILEWVATSFSRRSP